MMKKRMLSIFLIIAIAATLLTGCTSSNNKKGEKVKLTIPDKVVNATGSNPYTQKKQDEFDKLYGDEIEVTHILPYMTEDLADIRGTTAVLMGNDAPAFVSVSNAYTAKSLYNMGLTVDISKYVKDNPEFKNLRSMTVDAFTNSDGAIIGYPTLIEIPLLGFYNDSLQQAGYDPETFTCETWDDYYSVAEKMTTDDTTGSSLFLGEFLLWTQNWLLSNDAHVAVQNEDGTITLNMADDKVISTVEFMRKLYQNGHTNTNISSADTNAIFGAIYSGKVSSFTMYPTWIGNFIAQGIYPEDITLSTFPKGPDGKEQQSLHVAGLVFNSQLSEEELEAAIKYVTFMYGDEARKGMMNYRYENSISECMIPASKNVDWKKSLTEFPQQWFDIMDEALEIGVADKLDSNGYFTYICAELPGIVSGNKDIKGALENIQKLATEEWLNDYNSQHSKKK